MSGPLSDEEVRELGFEPGRGGWTPRAVPDIPSEPVALMDLSVLLQQVSGLLRQYVIFGSAHQVVALTLWVAHTHAIGAAESTPYIALTSPERRAGKSRTQDVLELLVARPWRAVNPSEAVIFRKVHRDQPTLLLDEIDAIWAKDAGQYEGLRALLNAGHRRGVKVPRMGGTGADLRILEFEVFGAKCIAGIGTLPDTVNDRCVPIRIHRRAPEEHIERFRYKEATALAAPIRAGLERWAEAHLEELRDARPELPDINDRAADGWEPLLAIADGAGGDWPSRARLAAVALHAEDVTRSETFGVRLLADIRDVFASHRAERLHSADLARHLADIEEAPWGDLKGRVLDARKLAQFLRPFDIAPKLIKIDKKVARGYSLEDFAEPWGRYLDGSGVDPERYPVTPQVDGPFPSQGEVPPAQSFMASDLLGNGVTADQGSEEGPTREEES